ncbi:group 1 glycosyl transferase [Fictibacillus macauensis ZFHKF-1]|uniref:Group 1 glycosyl transferase n=1 Tax=Fictibacillus macauensis ZFHKF-1 TaxID=1196324 RepID=I8UI25_9BACL|nr:glycosyltransferase [Fictibacillus macauensis]EIT86540.1 group 1 glycosyl transferase [Fictibacillus macauensis ZFHKF-1]
MKKKKIVFMAITMNIGGTEKALLSLLEAIPQDSYDITLLLLEKKGGFLADLPAHVTVKTVDHYEEIAAALHEAPITNMKNEWRQRQYKQACITAMYALISKWRKERSLFYKHLLRRHPKEQEEYDLAVAYAGPMELITYYIANHVKAKVKVQWIHFDISKIGFNPSFAKRWYPFFQKIFIVSQEGKAKLNRVLPQVKERTDVFTNMISKAALLKASEEESVFVDHFQGITLVTVGRLSLEKGQDMAISVTAKLRKEGYPIRWYCIGEGNARATYEQLIREAKLEESFHLVGATTNPYPYMKACDVYVQPSRHEGYCITLSEAKCFHVPIVTTDFTGASEQIRHEQTGIIVPPTEEGLYEGLKKLLDHPERWASFRNELMNEAENKAESQTVHQLLNLM